MMFQVVANLCDGNDYIAHWEGEWFPTVEEAQDAPLPYPSQDEIERLAAEDSAEFCTPIEEYDLQVGVWDECGECHAFYSEGV